MAYDLEEQEQIDTLKAWWQKYGNLITTVVLVIALAFAAWNGWQWYQRNQATGAAAAYEQLQAAAAAKDAAKVKESAGILFDQYSRTVYAQMGALVAAKSNFDAGDLKTAKAQLQWLVDNGRDENYKLVARLRLAGLLLEEGAGDDALKLVSTSVPAYFEAAYADRRGDILIAQNKPAEARAAYQIAWDKAEPQGGYRQIVQLKLDALGGTAPVAPTEQKAGEKAGGEKK